MKIMCIGDCITYGNGLLDLSDRWTDIVDVQNTNLRRADFAIQKRISAVLRLIRADQKYGWTPV